MRARDNPFRTERVLQVRYRFDGSTWEEFLGRCERLRYRGALIGPRGSGKTTLLEDLEARLRERGFCVRLLRLDEERPAFERGFLGRVVRRLSPRDIIVFDGAEQMNVAAWQWFKWRTRNAGGLIITTHRAGRLPTLRECRTSPELLAEIAGDLLGKDGEAIRHQARALFSKHNGNLREALREWYDVVVESAHFS